MSTSEHADQAPIITLAESFGGGDPVNALAIVLMKAWGEADPKSGVSQYPASYTANFADMARAALASTPSPAQPTEANEREQIMLLLNASGAYCGLCDYENAIYDDRSDGVEWQCADCEKTLGGYAEAILAAGFRVAPSPVQGADDRLAQIDGWITSACEAKDETRECMKRLAQAEMYIERAKELLVPGGDGLEAAEWLATYQQSPQAALNEVKKHD